VLIEIKSRWSDVVLFWHEADGNTFRLTLETAVSVRANLRAADLGGANLGGKTLIGESPVLQLGPLGSRSDYLVAFLTDDGIYINAGCFHGTRAEFAAKVAETHGDNEYGREYAAALVMIDAWKNIHSESVSI